MTATERIMLRPKYRINILSASSLKNMILELYYVNDLKKDKYKHIFDQLFL